MSNQNKSFLRMFSIIAVSALIYFNQLNASSLPFLQQEYPGYDVTVIKLFSTLPSLMLIPCSLLTSRLVQHHSMKAIVLSSAGIMLLTGAASYFCSSFAMLLALRALYGAGYGCIFPLASALVQRFFEGEMRSKVMGMRSAFGALCGTAIVSVGGWLTSISWRNAFLGYILIVPIILLVMFFCPANEPIGAAERSNGRTEKKYTTKTWHVLAFATMANICLMSFSVELSLVVIGENIGRANLVSRAFSVNTIFAFLAGISFGAMKKRLDRYIIIVACGFMGAAFLLGALFTQELFLYLFAALFGFGFGIFNPACNLLIASTAAKPQYGPQAIVLYTTGMGIGQFLYPYIFAGVKSMLGIAALRAEWMISASLLLLMCLAASMYIRITDKKTV